MKMRGEEWGSVFNSSGARGFWGEGYWYHSFWRPLGLQYTGSTFVAKTTTLKPRLGNMPLASNLTPSELIPKCIVVKPKAGVVLNSVGLSGPGASVLIDRWLQNPEPIGPTYEQRKVVHSFMAAASTAEDRLMETCAYVDLMRPLVQANGRDSNALQINFSCPNAGLDPQELVGEISQTLDVVGVLGIPVMIKVNALFPVELIAQTSNHPNCDAVVVSNTIPWGKMSNRIDWEGIFGTKVSPLSHLGGGALSGAPLFPIVRDWVRQASHQVCKPVVAGGGILHWRDAIELLEVGASAVELGSVSILRPWRVQGIIRHVNQWCGL